MNEKNIDEKKTVKSIFKIYGSEKFNLNKKDFDLLTGSINDQISKSINLIYSKKKKVDNFGYYIVSIIIITCFSIYFLKSTVNNFFKHAENNWDMYKCDPRIIPYSGYIKKYDDRTEFESTGDNFNECLIPISKYMASLQLDPFKNVIGDFQNISSSLNNSITNLQSSLNNLKDYTESILNMYTEKDNDKNKQAVMNFNNNLDPYLKMEAFMESLSNLYIGTNITLQSLMTYIYTFFEGALVLLTLFIIPLTILGGLITSIGLGLVPTGLSLLAGLITAPFGGAVVSYGIFVLALGLTILVTAFAFFVIFLVVVVMMIMYKGFLNEVFGINVDNKKTNTPGSPL